MRPPPRFWIMKGNYVTRTWYFSSTLEKFKRESSCYPFQTKTSYSFPFPWIMNPDSSHKMSLRRVRSTGQFLQLIGWKQITLILQSGLADFIIRKLITYTEVTKFINFLYKFQLKDKISYTNLQSWTRSSRSTEHMDQPTTARVHPEYRQKRFNVKRGNEKRNPLQTQAA